MRISRSPLAAATQWSSPGGYAVVAGIGPTEAAVDFVDDGDEVTVAKAASPDVEAFEVTLMVAGAGVLFDTESTSVGQVPLDGSAASFSCGGPGGDCGTGQVVVARGHTTSADVSGLPIYAMPPSTSGSYAVWLCAQLGTGDIEIPADAMAVILGTDPTRIEMRYLRANFAQVGNADGWNSTTVAVGHEIIGFTDVP